MKRSRRLDNLHEVIDKLMEENMDDKGNVRDNEKLDDLISIYRDISNIDSEEISKDDRSEISEILHHAYVVNGNFSLKKTGPDTYSAFFMGGFKNEYSKQKYVRFDLRVGKASVMFKGYEILQTNNH